MIGVIKLMRKLRHRKHDFEARMHMEQTAQRETAAKLKRLELTYKNKTRQGE